jgi:hypothetical protein
MTEATFIKTALKNPFNRTILERLCEGELADAWLVSGALFQTVWNVVTGRDPTFGIKDYDVFYFDPDPSWHAENAVINRVGEAFSDIPVDVEVRNQARVHLWYPVKFGMPYPPAAVCATDGIDRFLIVCAQIGLRKSGSAYEVYAPKGFDDIEKMIVRPNLTSNFRSDRYFEKTARWKSIWPELTILPAENGDGQ